MSAPSLDQRVVEALSAIPKVTEVWRGPGVLMEGYWVRTTASTATIRKVLAPLHVSFLAGPGAIEVVEPRAVLLWRREATEPRSPRRGSPST